MTLEEQAADFARRYDEETDETRRAIILRDWARFSERHGRPIPILRRVK